MIFILCASIGYGLATFSVVRASYSTAAETTAPWLLPVMAATLAHAGYHIERASFALHRADMHFFAALSFTALGMAVLTSCFAGKRRMGALGVVVYPLAELFLLLYASHPAHFGPMLDWQLCLHAWLALLAYATLSIAALLAIMLWTQDYTLRNRHLYRWLTALPPLTELEILLFRTIMAGFILLTFTLITGLAFIDDFLSQQLVSKTILSILSWVIFGALLLGRRRSGWRGRKAARLTLTAMALLIMAYFGSQWFFERTYSARLETTRLSQLIRISSATIPRLHEINDWGHAPPVDDCYH